MKVFLVATELNRTRGGIQYVNRLLARALAGVDGAGGAECSHIPLELSVFSYGDRAGDLAALAATGATIRAFARDGVKMGLRLARELVREQPDVVLFTHVSLLRFMHMARMLAPRARVAGLTHGVEAWAPLASRARRALCNADAVVAPSEYTARRLVEQNGVSRKRISVLPHALDPDWTAGEPGGRCSVAPTLLSVTRLDVADRPKGIDVVLRAMPHILERVPDARYVIVGDGNDRARLEGLAAALGIFSRVDFRGEVAGCELARTYCEADVFVLPSTKEGFGIVFAEAMWNGLPVIAARAAAAEEVVEDDVSGVLVPPESHEQIASAVAGLLLLEAERLRMGAAGRRRVQERYLFPSFVARWREWLTTVAPEAVYLARQPGLRDPLASRSAGPESTRAAQIRAAS